MAHVSDAGRPPLCLVFVIVVIVFMRVSMSRPIHVLVPMPKELGLEPGETYGCTTADYKPNEW